MASQPPTSCARRPGRTCCSPVGAARREGVRVELVIDNSDGRVRHRAHELSVMRRLDRAGRQRLPAQPAGGAPPRRTRSLADAGLGRVCTASSPRAPSTRCCWRGPTAPRPREEARVWASSSDGAARGSEARARRGRPRARRRCRARAARAPAPARAAGDGRARAEALRAADRRGAPAPARLRAGRDGAAPAASARASWLRRARSETRRPRAWPEFTARRAGGGG